MGFLISLVNSIRGGISPYYIIVRAMDLYTIVVPPALPATMSIGMSFALSRLKNKKIFCTSPPRINVSGKMNCVCFDKTGTLTEDGLDILGVRVVEQTGVFSELHRSIDLLPDEEEEFPILHSMATCHSLNSINNELIGDPLDLKMFQFTQWQLEELDSKNEENSAPVVVRPPNTTRVDWSSLSASTSTQILEMVTAFAYS